jgi:hypothetical protein
MRSRGVVLVGVLGVAVGCGRGVFIDEEIVNDRLDWLAENVPLCATPAGSGAAMTMDVLQATIRPVVEAYAAGRAWALEDQDVGPPPPNDLGFAISGGSCGGDLWFWSEHASGNTDYRATFDQFCIESQEGPIVLDGVFVGKERGKPSPTGPIISSFELSTEREVQVAVNGESYTLQLDQLRTRYGDSPTGSATPDYPNLTSIRNLEASFPDGRTVKVTKVDLEQISETPITFQVNDGQLSMSGEGRVSLSTPPAAPLVINLGGGLQVLSGTLEVSGRRGSSLTVTPQPGRLGVFDLQLNGASVPRQVDCGLGVLPFLELSTALLMVFPPP